MDEAIPHRHLGQHHDHWQAHLVEPAYEIGLGLLEAPVHTAYAVPGDVDLLREWHLPHLRHGLVEFGQDLLVVLAHLETLGIDDAQVPDLVEIEVAAASDRLTDTGPRHLLTEDRVDQGGLAHAGLAEDR